MKWLNDYKIKLVVVVFIAGMVLGGGIAKANLTFSKPVNLGSNLNGAFSEAPDFLSYDGLEMYLDSNRSGGYGGFDIWVSKRETIDDDWGEPVNLGPKINSSNPDGYASISFDGLELYFSSQDRTGGYGSFDIWVSTRQSKEDDWGDPVNLGPIINSSGWDSAPYISTDGLELYFDSNRDGGFGAFDIWVSRRATKNDPWGEPTNLGSIVNSSDQLGFSSISTDGLLLLCSDDLVYGPFHPGGFGKADMWMSKRSTILDSWSELMNLGPQVNGVYSESYPRISPDGKTLYFCSNRPGGFGGLYGDIWQASIIPIVDFDSDGVCDIDDLVIMIENWGTDEPLCDIGPMPWGDGIVDRGDLEVFMKYYNQVVDVAAYYKLDETEGDIAYDSSGNYYDAIVIGDPNWQPENGMIDGALEFDGIDDYINTPFILNPSEEFSVFAWVKGGDPGQVILSQAGGVNWLLADSSDGCLMTELRLIGGRSERMLISSALITDGGWHRVGFVWDGANRILYVDDFEVASDTQYISSSEGGLYIGAGNTLDVGTFWSDLIDDVRIYNRAITP